MDNDTVTKYSGSYNNYTTSINANIIHLRNPWVVAWWSAAFPGFGYLQLGSYVKGISLILWELFINVHTNLNLAMMYSFTARVQMAKEVLDTRLLYIYIPVYIFTIWDCYRRTVDLNKHFFLAEQENTPIVLFTMNSIGLNYLDKRHPWLACIWSFLCPGLGHLYLHRIPTGLFIAAWLVVILYQSNLIEAFHLTMLGMPRAATAVIDPEWLLFLPSIYCFSAYETYILTVEYNKLYKKEQASYLQQNYNPSGYELL